MPRSAQLPQARPTVTTGALPLVGPRAAEITSSRQVPNGLTQSVTRARLILALSAVNVLLSTTTAGLPPHHQRTQPTSLVTNRSARDRDRTLTGASDIEQARYNQRHRVPTLVKALVRKQTS